jgi:hypothetical protein
VIVAVLVADDVQVNVAEVSVLPWRLVAVAVKVCVAPTLMLGALGDTTTAATLVLSMAGPVGPSEPPPQAASDAVRRMVRTAAPRRAKGLGFMGLRFE